MSYKPKHFHPFRLVSLLLRSLASLLSHWPIVAIALFFISPVGPHVLWTYSYEQRGPHRQMLTCDYLGSRGIVRSDYFGDCPLFTIIDRRVTR